MRIIQISDSHIAHDIPQRLADLETCIEAVNELAPDLVIHTGDITHNALSQEYIEAHSRLETLAAPYYVLNGNKDSRDLILKTFIDHDYLQRGNGFFQYSIEHKKVRRENTSKGELCSTRLNHLKAMLAKDTSKPALIFMHHSPFVVEEIPDPCQFHQLEGTIGCLPVHVLSCMATDLRKGKLSEEDKTRPMYRVIDIAD